MIPDNEENTKGWELSEGVALAKKLEKALESCGYHVALGGGVLAKDGIRKDLDLFIYPHKAPDTFGGGWLWEALSSCGITHNQYRDHSNYGDAKVVHQCKYRDGRTIDLFLVQ